MNPSLKPLINFVVFDLGGVLIAARHLWRDALAYAGFPALDEVRGGQTVFSLPEYLPYEAGTLSEETFLSAMGGYAGLTESGHARRLHEAILGTEFSGVREIVAELKTAGVRTAALSNNNPIHWARLLDPETYPAIALLDVKVPSFELGYHKPQPEIFAAFERRVEAVGDRILFFEDNPANALAAESFGWEAVLLDVEKERAPQIRAALERRGVIGGAGRAS